MSHAADIKALPPPDLHALIKQYGSYSQIPPEAWAEYDRAMARWKIELRAGAHYGK